MIKFRRPWQRQLVIHITVLAIYVLMTGLALDGLLLNLDRALPGSGHDYDYAIFHWDMWWMRHALFDLRTNPFETDFMVYPFAHSLVLHTFVPFWGLLSIPLQSFMKIDMILNVFIVVSFLLTAYLTFLFTNRHGSPWSLSLLAGAFTAFTPAMLSRATDVHLNMLPMWWLPLSLLMFDLAFRSRRLIAALPLPLCLYAALLTDLQYMMWIPIVLVPYALSRFLSAEFRSKRERWPGLLLRLGLAATLFVGLVLLYPVRQLLALDTTGYPEADLHTPIFYSLPITFLFQSGAGDRTIGFLIVPTAIAVWILGRKQKGGGFWLAAAALSLLFALGPSPAFKPYPNFINIPLPYLALHTLLRGRYRCPVRFAVPAVFSLSVFIALKGRAVLKALGGRRFLRLGLVSGMLLLLIADYGLLRPFPSFFPKEYDLYHKLAEDSRDVVLLEVPFGIDTGYTLYGHGHQLIYYQSVHEKRIPSGAFSRLSLMLVDYMNSFHLIRAMSGEANVDSAAYDELPELIDSWNIGYVFVHRDLLSRNELGQIPSFFTMHPSLCFWQVEGDLLAYRSRPPGGCPPVKGAVRVDFGSPGDAAYVGSGWYLPEQIGAVTGRWAGGVPTATLRFDLRPQTYRMCFSAWAYPPHQVVTVEVNGVDVAEVPIGEALAVYTVTIPASAITSGEPTYIHLGHAVLLSAYERTQGEIPDRRPLGAAYEWLSLEPVE
jgi:hypothetical protein